MTTKSKTNDRMVCIGVNKRNRHYLDLLDDICVEHDVSRSEMVFRMVREWNYANLTGQI